jgi:hypothetical protein
MKISFKLFALLITCSAYGQQADNFAFLGNSFDKNWQPSSIKITTDITVSSNAINTKMFTDVLVRTEFTPEAKQKFVDGQQQRVNLYAFAKAEAEYKVNKTWGVYANTFTMNGYVGEKQLTELLFFGNAPFIDEQIESKSLHFLSYAGSGFGATYKLNNTDKLQAKLLFGLNALTRYTSLSTGATSLYTAPMGEYIDASVAQFAVSEQTNGAIKGVGLNVGIDLSYTINKKNSVRIALRDVNLTRMLDYTGLELDTSLRFTGIGYDFIRDTTTLQQYVDSNYSPILENARKKIKWATLPSRINLTWSHKLNNKSTLVTSLQSIDLGKYGITGTVGFGHAFSDRFKLCSSLGYGNYSGILWREAAEYRFEKLNVCASVQGLHAVFVPKTATNYGVFLGVTTHF